VEVLPVDLRKRIGLLVAAPFSLERSALMEVNGPGAIDLGDGLAGQRGVRSRPVGPFREREVIQRDNQFGELHFPAIDESHVVRVGGGKGVASQREHLSRSCELDGAAALLPTPGGCNQRQKPNDSSPRGGMQGGHQRTKRCTKVSAFSATSRQPLSMI